MELPDSSEDISHEGNHSGKIGDISDAIQSQDSTCGEINDETRVGESQDDAEITSAKDGSIKDSDVEADPATEDRRDLSRVSTQNRTNEPLKECVVDLTSSMLKLDKISPESTENAKEGKKEKQCSVKSSKKTSKFRSSTPRRSIRTRNKQKLYLESNSDSEIEEIKIEDPLSVPPREKEKQKSRSHRSNTIVVKDTKRLAELASGTKTIPGGRKEPTLIIIDTQSILSGKGPVPLAQAYSSSAYSSPTNSAPGYSVIPISLPTKGLLLPLRLNSTQTTGSVNEVVVSTQSDPLSTQQSPPSITNMLPSITDDMHIVEAPSFIVPYLYLKPPTESLKEYVDKIKVDLEEKKVDVPLLSSNECLNNSENSCSIREDSGRSNVDISANNSGTVAETCKSFSDSDTQEKKSLKDSDVNDDDDMNNTENSDDSKVIKEKQNDDASKNISGEKNDSKKSDQFSDMSSEIKSENKKSKGISPHDKKDKNTINLEEATKYFETPLGQFFIKIGMNLVEEYVQTDALRLQKRKRDREGFSPSTSDDLLLNSIVKNLEISKEMNEPFHHEQKKCEYCSFKTESSLVMAQHLETPHMRNYVYKCNFCSLQIRSPHDILFHMESEHCVRGRLERAPALHQCVNCTFEDSQKSKLNRHMLVCFKKYKADRNLEPPLDWVPPAKILRSTPKRPILGLGKSKKALSALPKLAPGPVRSKLEECLTRGRGRPALPGPFYPHEKFFPRPLSSSSIFENFNRTSSTQQPLLLPMPYQLTSSTVCQPTASSTPKFLSKNPQVSITPLPKVPLPTSTKGSPQNKSSERVETAPTTPTSFVVCEVCDGYIKDLEQLRNHMQWIHKVKIHPKMIHNRPPLNCQKCQSRFFTDQGLERHLLGTHGLVTSSIQEASNTGQDSGRCPICGRVYSSKLLNHVSKDHNLALRPAHLSYKCTVCTATFEMYKDFEHHVYSVHSSVAKRTAATKNEGQVTRTLESNDSCLMSPLKINDEVTVILHMAPSRPPAQTVDLTNPKSTRRRVRKKPVPRKILPSKDVQVIDLGDSPEEMIGSDNEKEDSEEEMMKRVMKQSKKVSKESLSKETRKGRLDTPRKRSKVVSEEEKINLESEESLQILKQLCKNVAENKMDDDNEDSLEILEELYKNVSDERDFPEGKEKFEIIKQLCQEVTEDEENDENAEMLWEDVKTIRQKVGEGYGSDRKEEDTIFELREIRNKNDVLDNLKRHSSMEALVDDDKEERNFEITERAKKRKSQRKNSDSSQSSVQSDY